MRGDRGPRGGNEHSSRWLVSPMHLHLFIPLFYIYYIYCHSHSIPSHPTVQSFFGLLLQFTVIDTYKHRLGHSHTLSTTSFQFTWPASTNVIMVCIMEERNKDFTITKSRRIFTKHKFINLMVGQSTLEQGYRAKHFDRWVVD